MAQKASFLELLQKLDHNLGRLEEAFDKNVRDFESWQDLLDELEKNLRETKGEDDGSFGFMLALLGPGKEVIYPHLLKLIEVGVFPLRAQPCLRQTGDEIPRDQLDDALSRFREQILGEVEEQCDLFEQRAFLICYMKKSSVKKLKDLSDTIQVLQVNDPNLQTTTVSIRHFGEENEEEMAWSPNDPDPGIEPTLSKSTPGHRDEIMKDLVKLYLIDSKWDRPTFLFEELIRVLQ